MKILLLILILAIIAGFLILFSQKKLESLPIKFYSARIYDTGSIFQMLKETGKNESYVILVFNSVEALPDSHIELQFSIEHNQLGFDWVLLGEEKKRDKEKFVSFAHDRGFQVQELEKNGVRYLRVIEGDIVDLCLATMKEIYKTTDDQPVEVIAKNFDVTGLPLITE
jgi:hypothetical protein